MPNTTAGATDIVDASLERPEDWFELPLLGDPDDDWAERLVATVPAGDAAGTLVEQLRDIRHALELEDPTGSSSSWVYVPGPQLGTVTAVMTWGPLQLDDDDTPESWLAGAEALADERDEEHEVRGFTSWRRAHPAGEAIGFAYLLVTPTVEGTEALIEERVVFGIFPPGVRQMIQLEFRSPFIGAFADMVAETGAIAESLVVELGRAA